MGKFNILLDLILKSKKKKQKWMDVQLSNVGADIWSHIMLVVSVTVVLMS